MADPEYTEFGIKIHKLRFTLKVQRRTPTPTHSIEDGDRSIRSRTYSTASSIADSLGLLNLDSGARSRRPIASDSNWEFYPMRTSTPSSGYNSTASGSVSRASSFSSKRLTSTDDSAYSEVYSTINEELSELADPFDPPEPEITTTTTAPKPISTKCFHRKTASSSSTLRASTLGRNSTLMPPNTAPPLPPRSNQCRPPARPPYPSTHVKQRSMWVASLGEGFFKKEKNINNFFPNIFLSPKKTLWFDLFIKMLKVPTEK